MFPPVGWPGSSNPSGTTTWTRTMLPPSTAPAAPGASPLRPGWTTPAADLLYLTKRSTWKRGHRAGPDARQDQPLLTTLERARAAAYPVEEHVGQDGSGRVRKFAMIAEKR